MKTVLFVCVHNAARSQMAEVLFNAQAAAQNLALRAASAGTLPARELDPSVVAVIEEIGLSMTKHKPKLLTPEIAGEAFRIISMGCCANPAACPGLLAGAEDWGLPYPAGGRLEDFRKLRDQIQRRVEELIQELKP